jgi:arginyl-tRNA synthetase
MPGLSDRLLARLQEAFDHFEAGADPVLRPSSRADFQVNGVLPLARRLGRAPRELAAEIVAVADLDQLCETVEIAGPGFLNLVVAQQAILGELRAVASDDRLGVAWVAEAEIVVIDYSGPNVAKEMHVGHIRSTIIGDALARMLSFVGHTVVRENHLGDWGTSFGMLIEHLIDCDTENSAELSLGDLGHFYQAARRQFEDDEEFAERARRRVVALQAGDEETLRLWSVLIEQTLAHLDQVYERLGVLLTRDDLAPESSYNQMLPLVVRHLEERGLLVESNGARCVFPPGFVNRQGSALPLIVQKSDGGFGYAATDLACIWDRVERLSATRLLYVIGTPQHQHLEMCFAVARLAGWLGDGAEAVHVSFGSMLGPDHKMLATRAGGTVKLIDLLDEAESRAAAAVALRNPGLSPTEASDVARIVGIAALKYGDLANDRVRDEVFDWDRMLSFEGNTAPYLQYAYARVRSIFRRSGIDRAQLHEISQLTEPAERGLGLAILGFADAVQSAVTELAPNRLCSYLFDLATAFSAFYEACPILTAPEEEMRQSRLVLADLTARTLSCGLGLLGITAPEKM